MLSKMLNEYELSQQYFVMYQVTLGSPPRVFVDHRPGLNHVHA